MFPDGCFVWAPQLGSDFMAPKPVEAGFLLGFKAWACMEAEDGTERDTAGVGY